MSTMLITGGCGFIGCNFIRYLLDESDFSGRVVNVDKLTYAGNPLNLADIATRHPDRYVFVQADVADRRRMAAVMDEYEVEEICHLAAESHVDRSIAAPDAFIQTNILGTYALLEAARMRLSRVRRFHHVSTDEVYGTLGATGYFSEETAYHPNSPYSASKAAADHLVRAYGETYRLPVTLSNCSNNYGPYQFPEKLIPLMILNAIAGKPLPVYGGGQHVRDWLYVRDHCTALWAIMQKGVAGATYTVGGRNELTNLQVVEMICAELDAVLGLLNGRPRRTLITFVKDRPGHDLRYAIDCAKIERELGWRPRESFATGLGTTIGWYRDHADWVKSIVAGEYRNWIRQHYGSSEDREQGRESNSATG
jgi:dTDP-glucose 4,6-dehydratase